MKTKKTSSVTFEQLRRLLVDLQFTESRSNTYWRFDHPESGTVLVYRPYAVAERVSVPDLAMTRRHLDWRGVLAENAFDDSLTKTPA